MSATDLDRSLVLEAVRVTEAAAIAAWKLVGRGDEKAADQAAVDAMRTALNTLEIDGEIVIGEGERDEAPMLYIGEKVGRGRGAKIDIALDPLEGTTLTAKAMANALAVMAWAPKGTLLNAPDTYMDKIACGPGFKDGVIDLAAPPAENVRALAKAKGVTPADIAVCVLDRPRHADIITSLREVGARIHLITDGDVAGAIMAARPDTGIDLMLGIGGTPEGIIAACALKCLGGVILGKLAPRDEAERRKALDAGHDLNRVLTTDDLVSSEDCFFAATGITDGELMAGVRYKPGGATTHSLVMRSRSGTIRSIRSEHALWKLSAYSTVDYD